MNLSRSIRRSTAEKTFAWLIAGFVLTFTLIPSLPAWAAPTQQAQSDLDALSAKSGQDFEVAFLSEMIQHHQSALDMAKLVPDQAAHQELKDAAQKITTDQTKEIGDMTGWLQQWYGVAPTAGMMHDMPGMSMSDMTALQSLKGDAFDKQFLNMMRMHHQGAVAMAQLVPSRATHTEVKTLAQNIITSQSAEIKQFESWLMTWYNVTPSSNMPGAMAGGAMADGSVSTDPMSNSGATATPAVTASDMPATGRGDDAQVFVLMMATIVAIAGLTGGLWLRKRGYLS